MFRDTWSRTLFSGKSIRVLHQGLHSLGLFKQAEIPWSFSKAQIGKLKALGVKKAFFYYLTNPSISTLWHLSTGIFLGTQLSLAVTRPGEPLCRDGLLVGHCAQSNLQKHHSLHGIWDFKKTAAQGWFESIWKQCVLYNVVFKYVNMYIRRIHIMDLYMFVYTYIYIYICWLYSHMFAQSTRAYLKHLDLGLGLGDLVPSLH